MITLKPETCSGCKNCVRVCPHGVLGMDHKKVVMLAEDRCIECGACQLNCYDDAIEVAKGTGCLLVIIKEDILGRRGAPAVA